MSLQSGNSQIKHKPKDYYYNTWVCLKRIRISFLQDTGYPVGDAGFDDQALLECVLMLGGSQMINGRILSRNYRRRIAERTIVRGSHGTYHPSLVQSLSKLKNRWTKWVSLLLIPRPFPFTVDLITSAVDYYSLQKNQHNKILTLFNCQFQLISLWRTPPEHYWYARNVILSTDIAVDILSNLHPPLVNNHFQRTCNSKP